MDAEIAIAAAESKALARMQIAVAKTAFYPKRKPLKNGVKIFCTSNSARR
jgi:hypothetical protein